MTRLIFVIGFAAITLSYLGANTVFAACTVDQANTIKTQDVVSTECIWNAPSNAYIIIKEVTWSIAWNESFAGSELYVTGSGQCSGVFLPTKCFPQFPAAHTADSGKKWVQERADQTYSGGSCHTGPYISFERDSSAISSCNNTEEECEQAELYWNFSSESCNSTPQECPGFCEEPGGIDLDLCQYEFGCPLGFLAGDSRTGECCIPQPCPVVVDVDGNGFQLTNAINGVNFDIDGDGDLDSISWTNGSSTNAWLALDRNGNGFIDNGTELFGNVTSQKVPRGEAPNGFLALAKYDEAASGGNGDGLINSEDSVFSSLRLWQDVNHNGISETGELHSLGTMGVSALELDYKQSKRTDGEGNNFRYRAKVKNTQGQQLGRWAWDVFLLRR